MSPAGAAPSAVAGGERDPTGPGEPADGRGDAGNIR